MKKFFTHHTVSIPYRYDTTEYGDVFCADPTLCQFLIGMVRRKNLLREYGN